MRTERLVRGREFSGRNTLIEDDAIGALAGGYRKDLAVRGRLGPYHQQPAQGGTARVTPAKRGKGNKARTADAPEDTTPAERRTAMSLEPSA